MNGANRVSTMKSNKKVPNSGATPRAKINVAFSKRPRTMPAEMVPVVTPFFLSTALILFSIDAILSA